MSAPKPLVDIRKELSALIADAVQESDEHRRTGLLTLADHWSDILRRRRAVQSPVPGGARRI